MNIELEVNKLTAAADSYRSGATKTPPIIDGNLLLELGCLTPPSDLDTEIAKDEKLKKIIKILIEVAPCGWATDKFAPLLSGLFYRKGLLDCTSSEEGAYALAVAIVGYMETDFNNTAMLIIVAKPHVLALLHEWLKRPMAWTSLPSVETVCRTLFAEDWCDLMLPDSARLRGRRAKGPGRPVSDLIATTRPAFLPGRCKGQLESSAVELPDNLRF